MQNEPLVDVPRIVATRRNPEASPDTFLRFEDTGARWYRLSQERLSSFLNLSYVTKAHLDALRGSGGADLESVGFTPFRPWQHLAMKATSFDEWYGSLFHHEMKKLLANGVPEEEAMSHAGRKILVPTIRAAMIDLRNPYAAPSTRHNAEKRMDRAWTCLPELARIAKEELEKQPD